MAGGKIKDLTGMTFGLWEVKYMTRLVESYGAYWWAKCKCGTEKEVRGSTLKSGGTKSCGCLGKYSDKYATGTVFGNLVVLHRIDSKKLMMQCLRCCRVFAMFRSNLYNKVRLDCGCGSPLLDLVGNRYGKLVVTALSPSGLGLRRRRAWICKCDCGNKHHVVTGEALISGNTKSCGCTHTSKGPDNCNWDPTKTQDERLRSRAYLEYKVWRADVYRRDGWKCKVCGSRQSIRAHHIMSYARFVDLRLLPINGITLCNSCHREFHKTYGSKNNVLLQFIQWVDLKGVKL